MRASLKINMLKLAASKQGWRLKFFYLLQAVVFYPFLEIDDKRTKSAQGGGSSVGAEGDDVYPLF